MSWLKYENEKKKKCLHLVLWNETLYLDICTKNNINKSMASFIFFISLCFTAARAQGLQYQYQVCSRNKFTPNSTFQTHLTTLFSSLSSKASNNVQFFNNTVTGTNPSDTVYGLFMCRGDIPSDLCNNCVGNATQRLSTHPDCSSSIEAVVYYDECIVRYSNLSFFGTADMEVSSGYVLASPINMTNQESFKRLVYVSLNETADEAMSSGSDGKKFATKETDIDIFQKLYCLAQCTPDLSPRDCRSCLNSLINSDLPRCCAGRQGGRVLYPNCVIRFEIYPFYRSLGSAPTPTPPPPKLGGNLVRYYMLVMALLLLSLYPEKQESKDVMKLFAISTGKLIWVEEDGLGFCTF